jgi:hypothetical protein
MKNPIYASRVPAFLFGLHDTVQIDSRAAVRLFLRHPLRDVFLGFSFEVVAQLVVQFPVRPGRAKQRAQPQGNRVNPMLRSHLQPPFRAARRSRLFKLNDARNRARKPAPLICFLFKLSPP